MLPHLQRATLNGRVFAFNTALCLLIAYICSIAPLVRAKIKTAARALQMDSAAVARDAATSLSAIQALGDTFSTFTPWDRKSPGEHVEDVRELMKTWRERHVAREE